MRLKTVQIKPFPIRAYHTTNVIKLLSCTIQIRTTTGQTLIWPQFKLHKTSKKLMASDTSLVKIRAQRRMRANHSRERWTRGVLITSSLQEKVDDRHLRQQLLIWDKSHDMQATIQTSSSVSRAVDTSTKKLSLHTQVVHSKLRESIGMSSQEIVLVGSAKLVWSITKRAIALSAWPRVTRVAWQESKRAISLSLRMQR